MTNTSVPASSAVESAGVLHTRAPAEVRLALALLWLSLAISVAQNLLNLRVLFGVMSAQGGVAMAGLLMPLAGNIFGAYVNLQIARKKNWARIIKLLCVAASLAIQVGISQLSFAPKLSGFDYATAGIGPALDFAAMYLLFITSGRRWFNQTSSTEA